MCLAIGGGLAFFVLYLLLYLRHISHLHRVANKALMAKNEELTTDLSNVSQRLGWATRTITDQTRTITALNSTCMVLRDKVASLTEQSAPT